jgi:hypothetical protein
MDLIPDRETSANVRRPLKFVDHRCGIVLNRNLALSIGIDQELVAA